MDYGQEKRGFRKLEYFLIITLIVVLVWAAWIMLEPVVRPVVEQLVENALESGLYTPTPLP
jgi:hypothetical protein